MFKFTLGLPQFESTQAGYAPRVHVSIAHPERVAAFGSVDFGEFPRGKTMDLGDVSLAAGAKQQIRVTDGEGWPVPGVAVMFVRVAEERIDPFSRPRIASQDADVARSALDGTLAFDGRLKPGRWTASLYRQQPDAQVEFVVPPSADLAPPATIVLPSGARNLEDLGPRRGPRPSSRRGPRDGSVRQEEDLLAGSEFLDDEDRRGRHLRDPGHERGSRRHPERDVHQEQPLRRLEQLRRVRVGREQPRARARGGRDSRAVRRHR